jgi:hypothetical protein
MARYIDADKLSEMIRHKADTLIEGKETFLYVAKWLELIPGADVVERSECENEKLADKYQLELEAMRGAANSYKMHYEKSKQEADRLAIELEAEKALREESGNIIADLQRMWNMCFLSDRMYGMYVYIISQRDFHAIISELKNKYLPGGDGDGR